MDVTCMLLRLTLCMVHYVSGVAAVPRDRTMGLDIWWISGSQISGSQISGSDVRTQTGPTSGGQIV